MKLNRFARFAAAGAAVLALAISPCLAMPPVIAPESLNVKEFGAVGDGRTDDTEAFQKAIAAAAEQGVPVFVPGGTYKVTDTLTLEDQEIVGYPAASWTSDAVNLPDIAVSHQNGPAVILDGGQISGLRFSYPLNQDGAETYPETIRIEGHDSTVQNVQMHSATVGVKVDGSGLRNLVLENLFLSCVHQEGVSLNGTTGAVIRNFEAWTPVGLASPFPGSGVGLHLYGNDDLQIYDAFVFNASRSFVFEDADGKGSEATLDNCMVDYSSVGVELSGTANVTLRGSNFFCHSEALSIRPGSQTVFQSYANSFNCNGTYVANISGGLMTNLVGSTFKRVFDDRDVPVVLISAGGVHMQGSTVIGRMPAGAKNAVINVTQSARDADICNNILTTTNGAAGFSADYSGIRNNVVSSRTVEEIAN